MAYIYSFYSGDNDDGLLFDLVSARLEDGTGLSDEQLVDNVISLLIAGLTQPPRL